MRRAPRRVDLRDDLVEGPCCPTKGCATARPGSSTRLVTFLQGRVLRARTAVPWPAPSPPSLAARFLRDGRGPPPVAGGFPQFGHAVVSRRTWLLSQGRGLLELARRRGRFGIRNPPLPRSVSSRARAPPWPRSPLLGEARDLPSVGALSARPARARLKLAHDKASLACPRPSFGRDRARLDRWRLSLGRALPSHSRTDPPLRTRTSSRTRRSTSRLCPPRACTTRSHPPRRRRAGRPR
jgi:hypothetical protein